MKVWQRSKEREFGKILLMPAEDSAGRFAGKIFSWLLSGFVLGLLAAVLCDAVGLSAESLLAGRIVFFAVFIIGTISAWLRNVVYGLQYRITPKALLYVRPLCGFEALCGRGEQLRRGDRLEIIPWDQIKSVDEAEGALALTLRDGYQISVGVTPVIALWTPTADGAMEKRISLEGRGQKSTQLDKESLKLILQKIRDIKKSAATKA